MMIDCDREKWPNFTGTWEMGKGRIVELLTLKENALVLENTIVFGTAILITLLIYHYLFQL